MNTQTRLISKRLKYYLVMSFGMSWSLAILYAFFFEAKASTVSASFMVMAILYMFTPMVSVILVEKLIIRDKPLKLLYNIRFNWNRWWLAAWLLPILIALLSFAVALLIPGVHFSPGMEGMFERYAGILSEEQLEEMRNLELPVHPFFITLIQGLLAGITINAVAGFGEELGWRGLMLRELGHLGFWKFSFIIGMVWGIWHAPIILMGHNYPEHPVWGVLMMTLFCVLFAPMFSLITIKSGSVIAASILHGSFNALAATSTMLLVGGNDLLIGTTGFAGFAVLIFLNLLIWRFFDTGGLLHFYPPVGQHIQEPATKTNRPGEGTRH